MPRNKYQTYRDRCRQLEQELARLRAAHSGDQLVDTIEYLLTSAETLTGAAKVYLEARDGRDDPTRTDDT